MNFDPLARSYWWLERIAFGGALHRCRLAFIGSVSDSRNVLILGEGDGRFLEAFLEVNKPASITVIDSSQRMIDLARQRVIDDNRVTFICGDIRKIDLLDKRFDLIITHFFLDCFDEEDARKIVRELRQRLTDEGRWLWSDFAIPKSGWMALPANCVVWGLYRFFRLTTRIEATRLVNAGELFRASGLKMAAERLFLSGLIRSELWSPESG